MKKILICIVAAMFATMTFAQHAGAPQHRQREFNPEEMAQRQTMRLHQSQGSLRMDFVYLNLIQESHELLSEVRNLLRGSKKLFAPLTDEKEN